MTYYSIDNGRGEELATGLREHEARAAAQRHANELGETVYVYDSEGSEYEHVDPDQPRHRRAHRPQSMIFLESAIDEWVAEHGTDAVPTEDATDAQD